MSNDDPTKQLPTDDRLNQLLVLVQGIDARLRSSEEKVDARLHETRPIWENVLSKLEDIETRLDRVEGTGLTTRSELRELRRELKEHLPAMK
jgi:Zn-dependent oligopeptidase